MLLAHAKAWHTYDEMFRSNQQGQVSIPLVGHWGEPKTNSRADVEAAERSMQWLTGWFAHPIFVNGDYPDVMKESVKEKSDKEKVPNR